MKRLRNLIAATGLLLSSFSWIAAVPARAATADELCVYTGTGTGFQDSTSWSGCAELSAGDSIELPASAVSAADKTITNSNPNYVIKNIIFTGDFSTFKYAFTGESINLTGNITGATATGTPTHTIANGINFVGTATQNITLSTQNLTLSGALNIGSSGIGTITGSGDLIINSLISGSGDINSAVGVLELSGSNTSYTGAINATAGTLYVTNKDALGGITKGTTIGNGAKLTINTGITTSNVTIAEPITLNGEGLSATGQKITVRGTTGNAITAGPYYILSGAVTLGSDVIVGNLSSSHKADLKLTGAISGASKKFTVDKGLDFELVLAGSSNSTATANGTYRSSPTVTNLADADTGTASAFTALVAPEGVTAGNVTISQYGYLKGKGTVGNVTVNGGTVAPGLSPGCLTATGTVAFTGGSLDVEINGKTVCTEYDQFIIDTAGTINLGTSPEQASLTITRTGFTPAVGDKFTIINNKNTEAITGTFKGLDEAATFKVSGVTYKITYVGGDGGNDVIIEVTAVDASAPTTTTTTTATTPGTPNTGITPAKVFANLVIVSFIGVAISWVLVNNNKRSTAKSKK